MFISMGNDGPGLNTAGDPGLCDNVVVVGASITKQTYLDDYGIQKSYDSLLYFSSRGPREDGGFQPQIVAPGAAVSSTPMWQTSRTAQDPIAGVWEVSVDARRS